MRFLVVGLLLACSPLANADDAVGKPPADLANKVTLTRVARSKGKPVALVAAPGSGALHVVEKVGTIRVLDGGKLAETPVLDLTGEVSGGSEQGLLGLAFHPKYATNRKLYVNYTDRKGDTRVVEYTVKDGAADPASARELLLVDQPYANHNGGHVLFGPDGKLYVGLGDGGAANDPHGHGQDDASHLGKMLAIDVDAAKPVVKVVAKGLRNPWRYSFDAKTGDLYLGDVGQDKWEEIHVVPAGKLDGANFGWKIVEGKHCFKQRSCDQSKLVPATVEYDHQTGCSITGGAVYRGKALPELDGIYFYADYCTALIRGFRWKDGAVTDHWDWKATLDPGSKLATLSSFGEDASGELYLLSLDGGIYKLSRATEAP